MWRRRESGEVCEKCVDVLKGAVDIGGADKMAPSRSLGFYLFE